MVDQRRDKRAPASLKVKYKSATVDEFIEHFGADVSRGGIFVKTKKPIENGALLKLELQLHDASPVIHGIGRVCWRREQVQDSSLPAGMGIKFIKLDPDSRAVVDRIVRGRGERASRFEQTQGAQLAAASEPPSAQPASAPGFAAAPPAMPPPRPSAPAVAAARREPIAAPRASAPARPAVQRPSSTGVRVAGLFADSPIAKSTASEVRSEGGSRSGSFFPPAPSGRPGSSPRVATPAPARAAARLSPPPPAIGSVPPPKPISSAPPGGRLSQARQSGQFLAAAFAEGGVAEETATQARAVAEGGDDDVIDELFAGVVDEPVRPSSPSATRSGPGSVDDVFAALSEEEGLSAPPVVPRPTRTSSPGSLPARRPSLPDPVPGARASQPDSVDQLFAELEDEAPTGEMPRLPSVPPLPQPEAEIEGEEPYRSDELGPSDDESFGEADLFDEHAAASAPALPSIPVLPADSVLHQLAAPQRSSSSLPWIVLGLLLAGGVGGFLYYQQVLAPQARAPQPAREPAAPQAPAAEAPAPGAPAQPATAAAGAAAPAQAEGPVKTVEIEVSSLPRASDISVDGKQVGTTPKHVPLPVGRPAQVTVSSAGYAAMTKTVVAGADTQPLRFRLEALPYSLLVRTDPPSAALTVGDTHALSPAPLELGHLDGSVQVSIAKDGFQRMTRQVRLDEFTEKDGVMRAEIEVTLSPLPGASATPAPAHPRSHHVHVPRRERTEPPPPPEPPAAPAPAPSAPSAPAAAAPAPSAPAAAAPAPSTPAAKPEPPEPPPPPSPPPPTERPVESPRPTLEL